MAPTEISPRNTNDNTAQEFKLVIGVVVSTLISAGLLAIVIILLVRNRKKNAQLRDLQATMKVQQGIDDYRARVLFIYETSHGLLPDDVLKNAAGPSLHYLPQHLQTQPWTVPEMPAAPRPTAQTPHTRSNNVVQRQGAPMSRTIERLGQLRQKLARAVEATPANDGVRQRDEEEMFSVGRDSDDSDRETVRPVPAASVRGESSSRAEASRSSPGRGASSPRQQAPASASGEGSSSRRQARFAEGS